MARCLCIYDGEMDSNRGPQPSIRKSNITLIGMAGTGKSSAGSIVAKALGWKLIDTDKLIEEEHGKTLQAVLDDIGEDAFTNLESSKVLELQNSENAVIAPGGSIVYSPDAMKVLKGISTVIYLYTNPEIIRERINTHSRGIVGMKGKTFQQLFKEREGLYARYADITIDASHKTPQVIAAEIVAKIVI